MTRLNIKWITTILTRLLYFMVASALLVALLTTLGHGPPFALLGRLASSSQAANSHCIDEGTWTTYTTPDLASDFVLSIAIEGETKWFGTNNGVSVFDGENWTTYDTSNSDLASNRVNGIAIDAEGNKWFGAYNGGVSVLDDGGTPHNKSDDAWTTYDAWTTPGLASNRIFAIAIDTEGNIWVGTEWGGVSKFDGATWTTYDPSNSGLASYHIYAIATDEEGNIWFATEPYCVGSIPTKIGGGVSKFDGTTWTTYNTASGLASNWVRSIAIEGANVRWFGGCLGSEPSACEFVCDTSTVSRFDGGWTTYVAGYSGLVGSRVNAIAIDWRGHKWFGTKGAGVIKFDGVNWTIYDTLNSELADDSVTAIVTDNEWNIWFGTYGGASKYGLPIPTPTPTTTWTPTPTPTHTPTPTYTPTPTTTHTPTPTPTATPCRLYLPLILKAHSGDEPG
jgi:hypothetical protein